MVVAVRSAIVVKSLRDLTRASAASCVGIPAKPEISVQHEITLAATPGLIGLRLAALGGGKSRSDLPTIGCVSGLHALREIRHWLCQSELL